MKVMLASWKISWLFTGQLDCINVLFLKGPVCLAFANYAVKGADPCLRPSAVQAPANAVRGFALQSPDWATTVADPPVTVKSVRSRDAVSRGSPTCPLVRNAVWGAESSPSPHRPPSGIQRFVSNFTFSFISFDYLGSWTKDTLIAFKATKCLAICITSFIYSD